MEYIVDIQGFRRSSNLFQLKELVIVPLTQALPPTICLFKAPCKWSKLLEEEQKTNRWLERNFHGIPWDSGSIPLDSYITVLQCALGDAERIYVKGFEKKRWLNEVLPGKFVFNMDEMRCPSLNKLEKNKRLYCPHHPLKRNAVCAVKNAHALKIWLQKRRPEQLHEGLDEVDVGNHMHQKLPISSQEPAMMNLEFLSMYS